MEIKKIEFDEKINLESFLIKLMKEKENIEKDNGVIFFSDKFLLAFAKTCKSEYIKEKDQQTINLIAVDAFGYKYVINLNRNDKTNIKLFKLTNITSTDDEADIFPVVDYSKEIKNYCFVKKSERTPNIKR